MGTTDSKTKAEIIAFTVPTSQITSNYIFNTDMSIGKGHFGKVFYAQNKHDTTIEGALKIVPKSYLKN